MWKLICLSFFVRNPSRNISATFYGVVIQLHCKSSWMWLHSKCNFHVYCYVAISCLCYPVYPLSKTVCVLQCGMVFEAAVWNPLAIISCCSGEKGHRVSPRGLMLFVSELV